MPPSHAIIRSAKPASCVIPARHPALVLWAQVKPELLRKTVAEYGARFKQQQQKQQQLQHKA